MHKSVHIDKEQPQRLPKTVKYCNASKVVVEILDQMAGQHTCKNGSRE